MKYIYIYIYRERERETERETERERDTKRMQEITAHKTKEISYSPTGPDHAFITTPPHTHTHTHTVSPQSHYMHNYYLHYDYCYNIKCTCTQPCQATPILDKSTRQKQEESKIETTTPSIGEHHTHTRTYSIKIYLLRINL